MNENEKKARNNRHKISDGDALIALRESDGWTVMNSWISHEMSTMASQTMDRTKTKTDSDIAYNQGVFSAYKNLLNMLEAKIKLGETARLAAEKDDQA